MMMKEVIEEIKRFIDEHEKTDSPLFVYYEPIKTNEKGKVLKNIGFLTTMDESIAAKSNNMYVTFYGNEYVCELDMRVWLRGIVPLSEIETLVIFEKLWTAYRQSNYVKTPASTNNLTATSGAKTGAPSFPVIIFVLCFCYESRYGESVHKGAVWFQNFKENCAFICILKPQPT